MKTADPSDPAIADLVNRAKLLRQVRAASRQFLAMGTLEQALRGSGAKHNVMTDDLLADPKNHDWSLLYQGSVLDD